MFLIIRSLSRTGPKDRQDKSSRLLTVFKPVGEGVKNALLSRRPGESLGVKEVTKNLS